MQIDGELDMGQSKGGYINGRNDFIFYLQRDFAKAYINSSGRWLGYLDRLQVQYYIPTDSRYGWSE